MVAVLLLQTRHRDLRNPWDKDYDDPEPPKDPNAYSGSEEEEDSDDDDDGAAGVSLSHLARWLLS